MEGKQKFQQEIILLVVVVMLTSEAFLLSPVAEIVQPSGQPLGQRNVSFSNDTLMGAFLTAPNLTFSRDSATLIRFGFDNCKCRAVCFTLGSECKAWSFIEGEGEASECRTINRGPETTNLINMTSATYFFRDSSVGGFYTWAPDHLLYVELEYVYRFQDAKERCAKIPGHRLTIAHSNDTYDFFIHYKSRYDRTYFWANLKKTGSREAQWGDGTNVTHQPNFVDMSGGDVEQYFVGITGQYIYDIPDDGRAVLCQANPLGIEW
ncbi:uncharacterized protein LOC135209469 [Macrobrachium nipponense]|uniref:uncharacterized protein LOC135209469 n=1 Tax=Macrobrachium nipponense TaxID=159736 RepID=UPI0030C81235